MNKRRFLAIIKKEFIHILRDTTTLILMFVVPVLLFFLYGYGISTDIKSIPTAVCDYSHSVESRQLLEKFSSSGYFNLDYYSDDISDIKYMLDKGSIKVALVIEKDFAKNIKAKKTAHLQVLLDGTDSNTAMNISGYIKSITREYSMGLLATAINKSGKIHIEQINLINIEPRVWYNPELKSINFIVPGLITMIMMLMGVLLTSMSIVGEKEKGTMEQISSSPVKPIELILGKMIPYGIIAYIDLLIITFLAVFWFNVPFMGNFFLHPFSLALLSSSAPPHPGFLKLRL